MNKKADLTGVIFLIVSVAAFAIFLLIVGYIVPQINSQIQAQIGISDEINNSFDATTNIAQNTLPTIWLIVFVILMFGLFVTSYFIPTHPVFIPVFILLLVIAIIISVPLSNAYVQLSETATLSDASAQQSLIGFFMTYLPYMTFVVGLISLVIAFAKPGGNEVLG